ncbi:DUF2834 domain-containing protein [Geminocystis sp. GBBB08]|uniref:DUF2834 domain-containing protein n=1 Tax=Geminocystis sp. GBBB08 TaxID=2604140 RepID=UPI0027E39440|nr:DUF2834 domain-containing protein [Geminocystis sp. GBBB08]MBL1209871.1 DUF2834 domain-containing protein [Geminocystis sp. GBBB08]
MIKTIGFLSLWLGFILYAVFFAPPDNPETLDLIINLSTGKWEGINPVIICLFNIMGILPFIYASFLIIDGRGQKNKAFPFVIGSFFLGAFALLPYFAFRQKNTNFIAQKTLIIKILDSRLYSILVTLSCFTLIFIAVTKGDWQDFILQWQTSKFIHVMSLDFCCLCLLFPAIIADDLTQRSIENKTIFWLITFTPLIGTLLYICFRPSLLDNQDNSTSLVDNVSSIN